MEDLESIQRRESIFDKLREINAEYEQLVEQADTVQTQVREKRQEKDHIKKLIMIMVENDCCPVEAQLKYAEELEEADNCKTVGYGYAVDCEEGSSIGPPSRNKSMISIIKNELKKWILT
ncbi:MAG: hypothetical protein K2X74_22965 [Acetobacteraceae bacterium]|nr:hypothetical protein [Acetobacteraceae bacterium]